MSDVVAVWTPAMVDVLRAHAWGRSTPAQIALMVGLSERSVRTKAGKIGVRFTPHLDVGVRARIADLSSQGWRPTRIARQLRVDIALVEMHLPTSPCTAAAPSSPP